MHSKPGVPQVSDEIRAFYRARATVEPYSTSPDFNLRELEIEAIQRHLTAGQRVLDVGCGNGYSTLCHAEKFASRFVGIDFVPEMIDAARTLADQHELSGSAEFQVGDATRLGFDDGSFDVVISQRCLLNLPSREAQWTALGEVARVLKPGGHYLMLEGTLQGLTRLNEMRGRFGLPPIPEADAKTNWFSNKFDEAELAERVATFFAETEAVERFGLYFLIARIVHPLLVAPDQPRYDAPINGIARELCSQLGDYHGIGHVALWILRR